MAGPVLLVHDDLEVIAAIRRLLAREGYEVVLATSAADAVIAFGHHLPIAILLAPSVESDRGRVVLDELKTHPDGQLAHVILLGETIPGYGYPMAPMPPDQQLVDLVNDLAASAGDSWQVVSATGEHPVFKPDAPSDAPSIAPSQGKDDWRAAPPLDVEATGEPQDVPEASAEDWGSVETPDPSPPGLAGTLFDDLPSIEDELHREVEAAAMANVDDELQKLEDEVRAEAARRREQRELSAAPLPLKQEAEPSFDDDAGPSTESSFAEFAATVPLAEAEQRARAAEARQLELREVSERAQKAVERAAVVAKEASAHSSAELEALRRDVQATGELARRERDDRAVAEELLEQSRAELTAHREKTESTSAEARSLAEKQISEASEALKIAEAAHEETRSELGLLSEEHQTLQQQLDEARTALADEQQQSTDHADTVASLEDRLRLHTEMSQRQQEQLTAQLETERLSREAVEAHATALQEEVDAVKEELTEAQRHASQIEIRLQDARTAHEESLEALREQLQIERTSSTAMKAELDAVAADRAELGRQLDGSREHEAALAAKAAEAEAHAKELEARAIMPLAPEGRPPLQVARHGAATMGELARLMAQLVIAQVEVKVELAVTGGTRSLWLKRGQLIAAESTLPYETLSDRARRDGLIDGRQETELRSVRGASAGELLQVMRERGLIRAAESVPLVQRYTEQVALDAFTENQCTYRLAEEPPPPEVLAAATPRATLPIVAEALRRALPPESLLEMLSGSDGVPVALDTDIDARALGFSERERRMLGYVDGEATIEMLVLAAGLKADAAYKALVVARLLGLIEVRAPRVQSPAVSPHLDVQRLDAKYDQVQEADYFSILGLPRNAGTDEVQRAFERLGAEFDPIRFSGHPDASLQQRAQVVFNLLEEAARALEDDRRRAEYARHLLD